MRHWVLYLIILVSFLTIASEKNRPAGPYPHVKNIIVIAIDTLAAQHLGFMGYARDTSPFMDELAQRSVVFNRAYTPESKTEPSFTSLLTGLHPSTHGIIENGSMIPDDIHFLTEDFKNSGFKTWGIPAANVIHGRFGFQNAFDFYAHVPPVPITATRVIEKLSGILGNSPRPTEPEFSISGPPIFLMLHFFDPHTEFTPSEKYLAAFTDPDYDGIVNGTWEQFDLYNRYELDFSQDDIRHAIDLYDAEIRTFDDRLRELFDLLDTTGLLDNSLIVLTADHGENLGEHHFFTHGHPYEKALNIPLLFHFPDGMWAGKRIDSLVEITDILPTLLDIAGIQVPENIDGQSLITLIDPDIPGEFVEREFLFAIGNATTEESRKNRIPEDRRTYGIFDGTHRLTVEILPDGQVASGNDLELFNIRIDPGETDNLVDRNSGVFQILAPLLERMVADSHTGHIVDLNTETLTMLRSLGYLSNK